MPDNREMRTRADRDPVDVDAGATAGERHSDADLTAVAS
jgi:hypothetical protein